MEQIKSILQKIEQTANQSGTFSALEKDLLLQYTRALYEAILSVEINNSAAPANNEKQVITEEPEIMPSLENDVQPDPEKPQLTEEPEEDFAYEIEDEDEDEENGEELFDDELYDAEEYNDVPEKDETEVDKSVVETIGYENKIPQEKEMILLELPGKEEESEAIKYMNKEVTATEISEPTLASTTSTILFPNYSSTTARLMKKYSMKLTRQKIKMKL